MAERLNNHFQFLDVQFHCLRSPCKQKCQMIESAFCNLLRPGDGAQGEKKLEIVHQLLATLLQRLRNNSQPCSFIVQKSEQMLVKLRLPVGAAAHERV